MTIDQIGITLFINVSPVQRFSTKISIVTYLKLRLQKFIMHSHTFTRITIKVTDRITKYA